MSKPRPAARAIVIHGNALLVMRRVNNGRRYMVIPGGRLEDGEDKEAALMRELAEETSIVVSEPQLVFIEQPNDPHWGKQYIYLCKYLRGQPELHPDSEEYAETQQGDNTYEPMWIPLDKFPNAIFPFKSKRLADEIKKGHKNGFPDEPIEWTL